MKKKIELAKDLLQIALMLPVTIVTCAALVSFAHLQLEKKDPLMPTEGR